VLFAVAAWGLGHATRDLVLIRALLNAGHSVTIISTERALQLLRSELGNQVTFIEVPDIPKPLSRRAIWFYVKMSFGLPLLFWTFWNEHHVVKQLSRTQKFDRIVSDTRYGVFLREIPSYFIVHSLRQIIPGRPSYLEMAVERAQQRLLDGARKILIPDQAENGLAGDLCHNLACHWGDKPEYIGILSSVRHKQVEPDIDYFISVSGAEPQRSIFEEMVLNQAHDLKGRVVVALGKPEIPFQVWDDGRVTVYTYLSRVQQEDMMNRARMVVSRSGYTTLMELAELGKRALFVPTVGQSEQEYLGAYHEKLGNVHTVTQSRLALAHDVSAAESYRGLPLSYSTNESVRRFLAMVVG